MGIFEEEEDAESQQKVFKECLVLQNGIFGIRDGVLGFWCIWDLVFSVFGIGILEERKSKQKGLQKVFGTCDGIFGIFGI